MCSSDLNEQFAELRQDICRGENGYSFDKPIINAALQAIEDWFHANKAEGVTAINTATMPYVFANGWKKRLFAYWLKQK